MKPRKPFAVLSYRTIFICLLAAFFESNALAVVFTSGIISFDYNLPGYYPGYTTGPGAIGSAGDTWNVTSIVGSSPVTLETTTGQATDVAWNFTTSGGQSVTLGGTYGPLFEDSSALTSSPTITGLTPDQTYVLYIYSAYWGQVWDVNGVNFSTPEIVNAGSVNTLTDGVNYDVETVTADATGTLTFSNVSSQNGPPEISAWQLTPVPEPSVCALLAVGASCLTWRMRVKNKRVWKF